MLKIKKIFKEYIGEALIVVGVSIGVYGLMNFGSSQNCGTPGLIVPESLGGLFNRN